MHKTSAWPLSQAWVALVVYASLYPFTGWRDQGLAPWAFLWAPLPHYWTGFDVGANLAGYVPLGFLLALSSLRRRERGRRRGEGAGSAVAGSVLASALLSFVMEATQSYLPQRVPSNVDFALNVAGAALGAVTALALEYLGAVDRWSRMRGRWFVDDARGALVLLALWPFALLFPAAVPLGLGQVYERVDAALADWLMDTPFLEWLPLRDVELQPLVPGVELLCVALGALVPCLLGYAVMRPAPRRVAFAAATIVAGVAVSALSAALSWGPSHAWAWLSFPVRLGLASAFVVAVVVSPVPRRGCAALVLLALMLHLTLLNQAPASAYFSQTLQSWEQGRFISFNGLGQWLGWLWPYVTLAYVVMRVSGADPQNKIGA